jgi:hypothetical protein
MFSVTMNRKLKLRTLPPYYGGGIPIERWPDPAIEVKVYRIQADWRPRP